MAYGGDGYAPHSAAGGYGYGVPANGAAPSASSYLYAEQRYPNGVPIPGVGAAPVAASSATPSGAPSAAPASYGGAYAHGNGYSVSTAAPAPVAPKAGRRATKKVGNARMAPSGFAGAGTPSHGAGDGGYSAAPPFPAAPYTYAAAPSVDDGAGGSAYYPMYHAAGSVGGAISGVSSGPGAAAARTTVTGSPDAQGGIYPGEHVHVASNYGGVRARASEVAASHGSTGTTSAYGGVSASVASTEASGPVVKAGRRQGQKQTYSHAHKRGAHSTASNAGGSTARTNASSVHTNGSGYGYAARGPAPRGAHARDPSMASEGRQDYKPHTLSEYHSLMDQVANQRLGGLGADLENEELKKKKQAVNKAREFAEKQRQINRRRLAKEQAKGHRAPAPGYASPARTDASVSGSEGHSRRRSVDRVGGGFAKSPRRGRRGSDVRSQASSVSPGPAVWRPSGLVPSDAADKFGDLSPAGRRNTRRASDMGPTGMSSTSPRHSDSGKGTEVARRVQSDSDLARGRVHASAAAANVLFEDDLPEEGVDSDDAAAGGYDDITGGRNPRVRDASAAGAVVVAPARGRQPVRQKRVPGAHNRFGYRGAGGAASALPLVAASDGPVRTSGIGAADSASKDSGSNKYFYGRAGSSAAASAVDAEAASAAAHGDHAKHEQKRKRHHKHRTSGASRGTGRDGHSSDSGDDADADHQRRHHKHKHKHKHRHGHDHHGHRHGHEHVDGGDGSEKPKAMHGRQKSNALADFDAQFGFADEMPVADVYGLEASPIRTEPRDDERHDHRHHHHHHHHHHKKKHGRRRHGDAAEPIPVEMVPVGPKGIFDGSNGGGAVSPEPISDYNLPALGLDVKSRTREPSPMGRGDIDAIKAEFGL